MTLFRPEVFRARQNRWTGQIILTRPFPLSFLTFCTAVFAAVLLLFAAFGSYTAKTTVQGQLLPQDGIIRVYAPDTGIISVKCAKEGGFVRAGETLFTLDSERDDGSGIVQRRLIADAELKKSLAEQEIVQRKRIHTNERSTLENTIHRLQIQLSHIKNGAVLD